MVQRFRSDLGLFVHLHARVTHGCFEAPDDDAHEVRIWPTEQLAGQALLRTLQRLHVDLAEHALDECEPPEDGVAACVQMALSGLGPGPVRTQPCAVEPMLISAFGLARVFPIDVSVCQRFQGPMRVLRAVTCSDEVAAALHAARPPPRPSPRGQLVLFVA